MVQIRNDETIAKKLPYFASDCFAVRNIMFLSIPSPLDNLLLKIAVLL